MSDIAQTAETALTDAAKIAEGFATGGPPGAIIAGAEALLPGLGAALEGLSKAVAGATNAASDAKSTAVKVGADAQNAVNTASDAQAAAARAASAASDAVSNVAGVDLPKLIADVEAIGVALKGVAQYFQSNFGGVIKELESFL